MDAKRLSVWQDQAVQMSKGLLSANPLITIDIKVDATFQVMQMQQYIWAGEILYSRVLELTILLWSYGLRT